MSGRGRGHRRLPMAAAYVRKSKASIAVDIHSQHKVVCANILSLRDSAADLLASEKPSKRARKELLGYADTLLSLQGDIQQKILSLMPSECTKYSVTRLQSESNRLAKTEYKSASRENLRPRFLCVKGYEFALPANRTKYSAKEACTILKNVQAVIDELPHRTRYDISMNKVIDAMINYKVTSNQEVTSLIPLTRSAMFRVYSKFKDSSEEPCWPVTGRPPILDNNSFLSSIKGFEKDKGRAISKKDMVSILKVAKSDVAKEKGNSITMVVTPTKRSLNNYTSLLPQLDPSRSKTDKVQQKSDARYIAERSVRNAISHIMAVAVSHYQIGKPDKRLKNIENATDGAKLLHKLVTEENKGLELCVVLPMFISTTDDTTVFAFEGAVDSSEGEGFIVCKDDDLGTRSAYTQHTSSTTSLRGLRIRHSVTFNAYGNAAPLYATIYGLTEQELPVKTCPSGVLPLLLPGFCFGGSQDVSNTTVGHIIFLRNTRKEDEISTDQLNHVRYRQEVFLPYVEATRAHYLRREGWEGDDDVEDEHLWVGWQVRSFFVLLSGFNKILFLC